MAGSTFSSRSYRDVALVLRTHKLGEADRIITCLTAAHGLVRGVAKGVRRTTSKFGATLEPFMVADVRFIHGRSLDIISQAQGRFAYGPLIAADFDAYTAASAMAEAAERLAEHETEARRQQFDLLHGAYGALSRGDQPADLIMTSYLLRALSTAGWRVTWSACVARGRPGAHGGFHAPTGGPVCADCRPPGTRSLSVGAPQLLEALQQGRWEQVAESPQPLRHEAVGTVVDYAQHHLERRFASLRALV